MAVPVPTFNCLATARQDIPNVLSSLTLRGSIDTLGRPNLVPAILDLAIPDLIRDDASADVILK